MTEDRKLASRSAAGSDGFTSAAAEKRPGSIAGRAGSSAPSSLEDALRALAAARNELSIVRSERDRLQRELAALGAMQTETIALTADDEATGLSETLPTLDDLMAGLNTFQEAATDSARSEPATDDVMLAPDLMFAPDDGDDDPRTRPIVALKRQENGRDDGRDDVRDDGDRRSAAAPPAARMRPPAAPPASSAPAASAPAPAASSALSDPEAHIETAAPLFDEPDLNGASALVVVAALEAATAAPPLRRTKNSRLLVFVDAEPPIKYPLYKPVMTIGRSETADIRVDGDYISRVHARIATDDDGAVTAEDVASKNGIRVNGQEVKSRVLRHGDVLSLGKLHFTFIDTTAADKG